MADLFGNAAKTDDYDASNIEVLEGLEPVRHRPGMYIGGTDDRALHHLAAEILDNSMDEAVAGHANRIDIHLESADRLTIRDNGRGMPTGKHPKFPDQSAVEVIMTTLHAGGKFSGKAYATSGGLHGVGASVVNALSSDLMVEIARDKFCFNSDFRAASRLARWLKLALPLIAAAHRLALRPILRFLVLAQNSALPRCTGWHDPRPIYLPVLKFVGGAIRHCLAMMIHSGRGQPALPGRPCRLSYRCDH
jgi:hypothetical protein